MEKAVNPLLIINVCCSMAYERQDCLQHSKDLAGATRTDNVSPLRMRKAAVFPFPVSLLGEICYFL